MLECGSATAMNVLQTDIKVVKVKLDLPLDITEEMPNPTLLPTWYSHSSK